MSLTTAFTEKPGLVPRTEMKGVENFSQMLEIGERFDVGRKAFTMFSEKGSRITGRVKPLIAKHATDDDGIFRTRWQDMGCNEQSNLTELVHRAEPWLLRFERGWAAEWVLKKLINQRVADAKRAKKGDSSKPTAAAKRAKKGNDNHKPAKRAKNDDGNDKPTKRAKNDDDNPKPAKHAKNDDGNDKTAKRAKNDDGNDKPTKRAKNGDDNPKPAKRAKNDDGNDKPTKRAKNDDGNPKPAKRAKNDDGNDKPTKRAKIDNGNDKPAKRAKNDDGNDKLAVSDGVVAKPAKKSDSGNKPVTNRAKLDKSVKEGKLAIYYCK
jgi:hypothetical protein